MKKREPDGSGYKTEETLKAEAKLRAGEQARLDAQRPRSQRRRRAENFWYHYKWHTIGGIAAAALVAVLAGDFLFREEPDVTVVMAVSTAYSQESLDSLRAAVEAVAEDCNGDGKVIVPIDSILVATDKGEATGPGGDYAYEVKLATVLAAGLDPVFLTDDAVYARLVRMAGPEEAPGAAFAPLPMEAAAGDRLPLSASVLASAPGCEAFGELAFSMRPLPRGGDADAYARAERLLQALAGG